MGGGGKDIGPIQGPRGSLACTFRPRDCGAALCPQHVDVCGDHQGHPGPQSAIAQGDLEIGHHARFPSVPCFSRAVPHPPCLASFYLHFLFSPRLNMPSEGLKPILHCYLQTHPPLLEPSAPPHRAAAQCQPETFPRPRIVRTCAGCVTCRAQCKMQGKASCSNLSS